METWPPLFRGTFVLFTLRVIVGYKRGLHHPPTAPRYRTPVGDDHCSPSRHEIAEVHRGGKKKKRKKSEKKKRGREEEKARERIDLSFVIERESRLVDPYVFPVFSIKRKWSPGAQTMLARTLGSKSRALRTCESIIISSRLPLFAYSLRSNRAHPFAGVRWCRTRGLSVDICLRTRVFHPALVHACRNHFRFNRYRNASFENFYPRASSLSLSLSSWLSFENSPLSMNLSHLKYIYYIYLSYLVSSIVDIDKNLSSFTIKHKIRPFVLAR